MHNNEKTSVLHTSLRIINQFLPVLFWITLILGFEEPRIATLTILSALVHESGHLIYLKLKLKANSNMRGVLSGFRIRPSETLSYREEAILYLSGPLANLCVAAALLPFQSEWARIFLALNVATALSNLLPIEGYDGYGALRAILEKGNPNGPGVRSLEVVSTAIIFSLCVLSIYFIDRFGTGYWIFAIFFASMLKQLGKWLKNSKSLD